MMRMRQAVLKALDDAFTDDPTVIMMGEDIAAAGGPFKVTEGLLEKHGPHRVIDTPISEMAFMGAAVGAAVCGMKPVVEMMFIEFIGVALDQLTTQAATMRYLSRGRLTTPLVVRASAGAGQGFGCQHSQMLDHWFRGTPGLKVVRGQRRAHGLRAAALGDRGSRSGRRAGAARALWRARRFRRARHAFACRSARPRSCARARTRRIVTCGAMVRVARAAAEKDGLDAEVIDLLTLWPWDRKTVLDSVTKTGRLVTVEEATAGSGWGADVVSAIASRRSAR